MNAKSQENDSSPGGSTGGSSEAAGSGAAFRNTFAPAGYEEWRAGVEADLNGADFSRRLVKKTADGLEIEPLYTADHPEREERGDGAGDSGAGAPAGGIASSGWVVRQLYNQPSIDAARAAILDDIENGVTSVELCLDEAFCSGLDADADGAAGLSAVGGLAISGAADFAQLLDGVDLRRTQVSLDAGAQFIPAAALLVGSASGTASGVVDSSANGPTAARDDLRFAFNADPLGVLAASGRLPVSLDAALARMADLAAWTSANLAQSTSVRISTSAYHEAGAGTATELAVALATGVAYLRALTDRGLDLETAASQMVFDFSLDCDCFIEIAKLRAARQLWARVLEASGAPEAERGMRLDVRSSRRVMTQRDPWINMLRATAVTFAGAAAGVDSIALMPFDACRNEGSPWRPESTGTAPTAQSALGRRVARNTQHILNEESHMGAVADPSAGSWYVESLTDQIAVKAWAQFQEIEAEGGMAEALWSGTIASRIAETCAASATNVGRRKQAIIGVSEFPNLGEELPATDPVDLASIREAAGTRAVEARARAQGHDALANLAELASGSDRMPGALTAGAIEAAASGATIGQLAEALNAASDKSEQGQPASINPLPPSRLAEPFEALRDSADRALAETGSRPSVFLANIGPPAAHAARAGFAKSLLEVGGFEVVAGAGATSAEEIQSQFAASNSGIAVLCSSDDSYEEHVNDFAAALKAAGARTVLLAGRPGENEAAWRAAGVDDFIFIGSDALATLCALHETVGVTS